jgi:hypothetical protein
MTTDEAWSHLELAYRQRHEYCPVVVSPQALALVLAERLKAEQGKEDGAD